LKRIWGFTYPTNEEIIEEEAGVRREKSIELLVVF
jgi:hypothetical protein